MLLPIRHTRPVYNIHVGDCKYTSLRVAVLHLNNPVDLSGRESNWLNSPDDNSFSASLVWRTMHYLTLKSQEILSHKKHVETCTAVPPCRITWKHAREASVHLWCQMFAFPLKYNAETCNAQTQTEAQEMRRKLKEQNGKMKAHCTRLHFLFRHTAW